MRLCWIDTAVALSSVVSYVVNDDTLTQLSHDLLFRKRLTFWDSLIRNSMVLVYVTVVRLYDPEFLLRCHFISCISEVNFGRKVPFLNHLIQASSLQ